MSELLPHREVDVLGSAVRPSVRSSVNTFSERISLTLGTNDNPLKALSHRATAGTLLHVTASAQRKTSPNNEQSFGVC